MFFFRSCSSRWYSNSSLWYSNSSFWFFPFSLVPFLLEVSLHYIIFHCSILSSTCLPSSLVLEFLFLLLQLFDFLGVKVISNTVQRSSPHKCGQESCCNAFNAVVAAFSQDISASLSLLCTLVIYLHLWNFLEGRLRGAEVHLADIYQTWGGYSSRINIPGRLRALLLITRFPYDFLSSDVLLVNCGT